MLVYKIFKAKVKLIKVCSTNKLILELSSNRCKPDWFLSLEFINNFSTKGFYCLILLLNNYLSNNLQLFVAAFN